MLDDVIVAGNNNKKRTNVGYTLGRWDNHCFFKESLQISFFPLFLFLLYFEFPFLF
jgi:hypothetical protein